MRKIAVCILVIVTVLCSTVGISEKSVIDFSVYTLDELVAIREALEREMITRDGYQMPMYTGVYIVGRDIDAGHYIFTCTETTMDVDDIGIITVYRDESQDEILYYDGYFGVGHKVSLNVPEEAVIKLTYCSGTFAIGSTMGSIAENQIQTALPETASVKMDDSSLRPEFQKAMDEYEAFYERYVELMTADDLGFDQLADYLEMIEQLTEIEESFDAWDGKMNDAETKYYFEVQMRVLRKLSIAE